MGESYLVASKIIKSESFKNPLAIANFCHSPPDNSLPSGISLLKKLNDDQELYNALQKVGLYEKVKNYQFNLDTYMLQ
jgi:hypothetical protein